MFSQACSSHLTFSGGVRSVRPEARAFTILELLVSMAVLMLLAVLSQQILGSTATAWKSHKARLGAFEGARAAFDSLTSRLSQATLNTYWDYDNPAQPQRYLRQSELHFITGKASSLLPDAACEPPA